MLEDIYVAHVSSAPAALTCQWNAGGTKSDFELSKYLKFH